MGIVRRVGAVYLVAVALAVAVFFVINQFLDDSVDVVQVWSVLNVPMVIGLAAALIFNLSRKMEEGCARPGSGRHAPLPGGQPRLLRHRGRFDPVLAQLVFPARQRPGQPRRQPPGLGHLAVRGHCVAAVARRYGLQPVARGPQLLKLDGLAP